MLQYNLVVAAPSRDETIAAIRASPTAVAGQPGAMLAGTTFCVLSATCYVGLSLLERYLEGEAREKGRALLSGEAVEEDQATALARLLLIFFPTCRLPASACAEEASRERSGTCQERAKNRRASLAAVALLQTPNPETNGAPPARDRPLVYVLLKALDNVVCLAGPASLCFAGHSDLTSRAFRTAAVARALLPACVTLDVAVAQIAALMDLGREQVAGFKILNFAVRGFVWCLSARLRAGHG